MTFHRPPAALFVAAVSASAVGESHLTSGFPPPKSDPSVFGILSFNSTPRIGTYEANAVSADTLKLMVPAGDGMHCTTSADRRMVISLASPDTAPLRFSAAKPCADATTSRPSIVLH